MNWKFIFNTDHMDEESKYLYKALWLARNSGYKFLIWNNKVITIENKKTGIKRSDCF